MNKVIITGRLTKDPEIRYTAGENPLAVANFIVAVDRAYKKEGQTNADFPKVTVMDTPYRKTVENFVKKYIKKGSAVEVEGEIRTGKYEKDGVTHYTTEIFASNIGFVPRSSEAQSEPQGEPAEPTPQPITDDIPF